MENPAGLAQFQGKVFDIQSDLNQAGSPNFLGAFSSGQGSFGYGLEIERVTNDFVMTAGFGAKTGSLAVGVNADVYFSSLRPTLNFGLIQSFKKLNLGLF